MKTLYISDLDGTLLNEQVELSQYTISTLNKIIKKGNHFTVATARTAATITKILENVNINLPVILMNGVLIYDLPQKRYLHINYLTKDAISFIYHMYNELKLKGFMYEIKDHSLLTYYENLDTKPLKEYYEERFNKYQKPFKQVPDFREVNPENIIYFAFMGKKDKLDLAYKALQSNPDIATAYYKDIYTQDDTWYLEVFSAKATKYSSAQVLRNEYHFDYLVGFGDNLNDIPLCRACDKFYAVSNAHKEVRSLAHSIIGSNKDDGVAHWLDTHL